MITPSLRLAAVAAVGALALVGGGFAAGSATASSPAPAAAVVTAMTPYTGSTTITKCGTTIDHKIITGNLTIAVTNGVKGIFNDEALAKSAACVILTNDVIDMQNPGNGEKGVDNGYLNYRVCSASSSSTTCVGGGAIFMADDQIISHPYTGTNGGYTYGFGSANIHAWRISESGGPTGLSCEGYCELHNSTLTADYASGGSHMDAIISNGNAGAPMLFDGNTLRCEELGGANVTSSAGCSAPVGFFGDNTAISNITFTNNTLAGTSSTHWCSYSGASQPNKPNPTGTNIVWTGNHYNASQCKHAGGFLGPVADWAANKGNVWCNNDFTDGTTAGLPADTAGCGSTPTTTLPATTTTVVTPSTSVTTTIPKTTTTVPPTTTVTSPPSTTSTTTSSTTATLPTTTTTTVEPTFSFTVTCTVNTHKCSVG